MSAVGKIIIVKPDSGNTPGPTPQMLTASGGVPPDDKVFHLRLIQPRWYTVQYAAFGNAFDLGDVFITGKNAGCVLEFVIGGQCAFSGGAIGCVDGERTVCRVNMPLSGKANAIGRALDPTPFLVAGAALMMAPIIAAMELYDQAAGLPPAPPHRYTGRGSSPHRGGGIDLGTPVGIKG